MRVIVAGTRTCESAQAVSRAIEASGFDVTEVVSGGAQGVDALGEAWAAERGIKVTLFPADWAGHGRRAGPVRNEKMADYADALVAIWDGKSPGTRSMCTLARRAGLRVHIDMGAAPDASGESSGLGPAPGDPAPGDPAPEDDEYPDATFRAAEMNIADDDPIWAMLR